MYHEPVLLKESIEALRIRPSGTYVDATFGGGGHSREILDRLEHGRLVAFDQDPDAAANVIDDSRFLFINQNFRYLRNYLFVHGITRIDGLLADLGVSSYQFDTPERGFSTRFDQEVDMRMDTRKELTGLSVLNDYPEEDLSRVLYEYGELKQARKLARALVSNRPLSGPGDLKDAISRLVPKNTANKVLARFYQAIRMEVNDELQALRELLEQSAGVIGEGGRLVIISYHSLEDRLVKNFMRSGNFHGEQEKDFYGNPLVPFQPVTRKPVTPDDEEIAVNSRARSAKMRVAERTEKGIS